MKKIYTLLVLIHMALIAHAQSPNHKIYGTITDAQTGEPLPFANVTILQGQVEINGSITDFDGNYVIMPLPSDTLTLRIIYMGYQAKQIHNIELVSVKERQVNIQLDPSSIQLNDMVIAEYGDQVIEKDHTTSRAVVHQEDFQNTRTRSATNVAQNTAGVYSAENNGNLIVRGSRSDANYYYIDGMKVLGTSQLPRSAINQRSLNPNAIHCSTPASQELGATVTQEDFENMAVRSAPFTGHSEAYTTYYSRFIAGSEQTAREIAFRHDPPKRESKSHLPYEELLRPQGSSRFKPIYENQFETVYRAPLSTFSADVDHAGYSIMRRYISNNQLPPVDAVRLEELVNYFDYDYPSAEGNHPFSIYTEYTVCPWNPKNLLVHVGVKAKDLAWDSVPPNNLVFLLDVSGSMSSEDKLGLVKKGMHMLIDQLRPQDKVSIVVYAGASGVVLSPTSGTHKHKIREALNRLSAGGSTAGAAGIQQAYKLAERHFDKNGNNRIILATDGDFNVGISNVNELEKLIAKKRETGIYLTVMGFGSGNLQDEIMETLADKGNGNYYYIDDVLEAKRVMVERLTGSLITVANDVKFQVEFNPSQVQEYRLLGYENRKLNDKDFEDDTKDAGDVGAGQTVTLLYEVVPQGSASTAPVQNLRYQTAFVSKDTLNQELLVVNCRYKQPGTDTSILMNKPLVLMEQMQKPSENMMFSASIIEFGLLLRNSSYSGHANFTQALALAKASKGEDESGYRAECIKLMQKAELLLKDTEAQLR